MNSDSLEHAAQLSPHALNASCLSACFLHSSSHLLHASIANAANLGRQIPDWLIAATHRIAQAFDLHLLRRMPFPYRLAQVDLNCDLEL